MVGNKTLPDDDVLTKLGIAIDLKKDTILFRDDFRNYSHNNQYPLNLMLFLRLF